MASTATNATSLPDDDVLLHIFGFSDRRSVCAAARTCRHWHSVVHGDRSGPLWKGLIVAHCPVLLDVVATLTSKRPSLASGTGDLVYRDLFLGEGRMSYLVKRKLREGIAERAQSIRQGRQLFGSTEDFQSGNPYSSPSKGTTSYSTPDSNGAHPEPVYYDWDANWDQVSKIVQSASFQVVLKECVETAEGSCDDYYSGWNPSLIWPFRFNNIRYLHGNGQEDSLIATFIPRERLAGFNEELANQFEADGNHLIDEWGSNGASIIGEWIDECEEFGVDLTAEQLTMKDIIDTVTNNFEDANGLAEDTMTLFLEEDAYHLLHQSDLLWQINKTCVEDLYKNDDLLRATLLCTMGNSYAFMPLNYNLAQLVSPPGTELTCYASKEYSVVVDEKRNIVFDNFWYFCDISASETLSKARDLTQLDACEFQAVRKTRRR